LYNQANSLIHEQKQNGLFDLAVKHTTQWWRH
jgi:hypothetical protein